MKPNGSNWRHGRARLDLSAEEAAVRLRISPNYLRNIESNQVSATPSERLVYRAAALYGVDFDDLVDTPAEEPANRTQAPKRDSSASPRSEASTSAGAA